MTVAAAYKGLWPGWPGAAYHLSPSPDNDCYQVRYIVERIARIMGTRLEHVAKPGPERLGQNAAYVMDSTKARTEFGWPPHLSIDEGLADVVRWVEDCWDEIAGEPLKYVHLA